MERDLAAAPGVLPTAHLPLVRHRRRRLHRAHRTARRDQPGARAEARGPLLQQAGRSLSQPRRAARPARRAVDPDGAAAIPAAAAHQRPVRRGRRRHQGAKARPQDAGCQTPASAVQVEHQTRIHHGTLPPGREPARAGRRQRLRRAACHPHPRGGGVVQPRPPHLARQESIRISGVFTPRQLERNRRNCRSPSKGTIFRRVSAACHQGRESGSATAGAHHASSIASAGAWRSAY